MVRQYVGARYVPKLASPVEWASNTSYEALTIVTFNNASYTSKVPVPPTVGNPANNPQYWALTGNYNAQVEQYRQETETVSNSLTTEIANRKNADTALQGQISRERGAREEADSVLSANATSLQTQISEERTERSQQDAVLSARMDSFSRLPEGSLSTAADAELKDIRVMADGETASTAGNAVREQFTELKNDLDEQKILYPNRIDTTTWADAPFEQVSFSSVLTYLNGWSHAYHTDRFPHGTKVAQPVLTSVGEATDRSGLVINLTNPINHTERDLALLVYSPSATTKQVSLFIAETTSWSTSSNFISTNVKLVAGWNYVPLTRVNGVNNNDFTRVIVRYEKEDVSLSLLNGTRVCLIQGTQAFRKNIIDTVIPDGNEYSLIAYGDSLTQGAGSSGDGHRYLDVCKTELEAKNDAPFGYGGSASKAIAFTAGAISGYLPPNLNSFSMKYADLNTNISIANNQLSNKTVIIDGEEYKISQSGATSYSLPETYTPSDIWLPVTIKNATLTADIYIIWVGTNDHGYKWDIIDAMIAKLPHKQYVIMGLTRLGTDTTVENELKAYEKYGSHFFNTRIQVISNAFAVLGKTPTTEDTTAMNAGLMPPSLLTDSTHFNDDGYEAIGKLLAKHIKSLGYKYQ